MCALLLLFGPGVWAQAPAVQELKVDISSEDLVRRVRAAIGDDAAWKAVTATISKGSIEIEGMPPGTFEEIAASPDRCVTKITLSDQPMALQGSDGHVAWEKDAEGVRELQGDELKEGLEDCVFLSDFDLRAYKDVKVAGKARQGDFGFYLVDTYTTRGSHVVLTIDSTTFLPAMSVVQRHIESKPMAIAVVFKDYRDVGGLKLPHLLASKLGGMRMTIKLSSIAVVPPPDVTTFSKPG